MNRKTIKDICLEYGYSQTALAKRFGIPLRTVQNWHGGQREPAPYVVPMREEILRAEQAAETKVIMVAEWREVVVNGVGYHRECTACGARWMLDSSEHVCKETPFCPNCGAKMKS